MKVVAAKSFFKSLKSINSLESKWYSFLGWFKYHFNKDNFNLMKVCWKGRAWDYAFLYKLEQAKIKEMVNYHKKHQRFVGVEQVIRNMEICIKLIDIFLEEDKLFHYTGDIKFEPLEDGNYEFKNNDLKYHCDVKVNLRNIKRFITDDSFEYFKKFYKEYPHEFFILKAKALYHKIRFENDGTWWD